MSVFSDLPLLEELYGAPWPYIAEAGIGLEFKVGPEEPRIDLFREALDFAGCPHRVRKRITEELLGSGVSRATVGADARLKNFISYLPLCGITMTIIDPKV